MTAVAHRPRLTLPIGGRDHIRGPESAPYVLLEYGDYQCPYCRAAQGVVEQLLVAAGDEIRYAYRHFPLSQIHPQAALAAEAAEAAGAQGRFWEMHELLFQHQDRLTPHDLLGYASALRLDVQRVALELERNVHRQRVREDFLSGVRSGVNGTPTFFINGVRHNGGWDLQSLLEALREAA